MARSLFSQPYGELLRALVAARKSAGLKQVELAGRLDKPQSFVSKIERGERRLDVVELLVVLRAIGVDEELFIAALSKQVPKSARI